MFENVGSEELPGKNSQEKFKFEFLAPVEASGTVSTLFVPPRHVSSLHFRLPSLGIAYLVTMQAHPVQGDSSLDEILRRFDAETFNALTGLQPATFSYLWNKYGVHRKPNSPLLMPYVQLAPILY